MLHRARMESPPILAGLQFQHHRVARFRMRRCNSLLLLLLNSRLFLISHPVCVQTANGITVIKDREVSLADCVTRQSSKGNQTAENCRIGNRTSQPDVRHVRNPTLESRSTEPATRGLPSSSFRNCSISVGYRVVKLRHALQTRCPRDTRCNSAAIISA